MVLDLTEMQEDGHLQRVRKLLKIVTCAIKGKSKLTAFK